MGNIVVFVPSDHVETMVNRYLDSLPDRSGVKLIRAGIHNVIDIARGLDEREVDVIVSRGNTSLALANAQLPFPVITMQVGVEEIAEAFEAALTLSNKEKPLIGVSGYEPNVSSIEALLRLRGIEIRFYPIMSLEDVTNCVNAALLDKVDVVISGAQCTAACRTVGMPAVEMKTSLESVSNALHQAFEFQKSSSRQRARSEEETLFSRYTKDILLALDQYGRIVSSNQRAALFFDLVPTAVRGLNLFTHASFAKLGRAGFDRLADQASVAIIRQQQINYALTVNRAQLSENRTGYIAKLQAVSELQHDELAVRKALSTHRSHPTITTDQLPQSSIFEPAVLAQITSLAQRSSPLLIASEPGSGSDLLAHCIHRDGPRRSMPFVWLDCDQLQTPSLAAPTESLLRDQLTHAHRGTIFLENIENMPLHDQLLLLSLLRGQLFPSAGEDPALLLDVRIIASARPDIIKKIDRQAFKADLFWVLSQSTLHLSPLAERMADIPNIYRFLMMRSGSRLQTDTPLSGAAVQTLTRYRWRGNLHQLAAFCRGFAEQPVDHSSPLELQRALDQFFLFETLAWSDTPDKTAFLPGQPVPATVLKNQVVSRDRLQQLLRQHGDNKTKTAAALGVSRTTLWKALKELDLQT